MNKRKTFGFTLAEVLITLGIVGVIAAMTIPALINNYQKTVVLAKLKKVYSHLNQVIKIIDEEQGLSVLSGNPKDFVPKYILPHYNAATLYQPNSDHRQAMCYNPAHYYWSAPQHKAQYNTLASKGRCTGVIQTPFLPNHTSSIELPDGTCIGFNRLVNSTAYAGSTIFVDVNGSANPPNCFGKDLFFFYLDDETTSVKASEGAYPGAYTLTARIFENGIKFPKDYPW